MFFINQAVTNKSESVDSNKFVQKLYEVKKVLAIAQHHDAVTGTARENVSEDYITMMEKAVSEIKKFVGKEPVTVWFNEGSYYLNKTIEIGSEMSGTADNPVISFVILPLDQP